MKISVVTAVFNREATIAEAISSVQKQNYPSVEQIVQDGGSTDRTLQILNSLNTSHISLESGADGGIYDAINRGIARANGDVVGLMHSDDFFAHDNVLSLVAEALLDPDISGVYGDLQYVSSLDSTKIIRHWRAGEYTRDRLKQGWMPPHPTLYLRREVFESWGLYDTSYSIAADYDAMLRYLAKGDIKLAYIPEVLVKMRVGGESNRSLARILQKSREDYRAIKQNNVGGFPTLLMKNTSKIRQFF